MRSVVLAVLVFIVFGSYIGASGYISGARGWLLVEGLLQVTAIFCVAAALPMAVLEFVYRRRRPSSWAFLLSSAISVVLMYLFSGLKGFSVSVYSVLIFPAGLLLLFFALAKLSDFLARKIVR